MQLNLVTMLTAPAPVAPANSVQADEGGAGDFAAMLGDAAGQGAGQQTGNGALPQGEAQAAALIAQELDPESLAVLQHAPQGKLAQLLDHPLEPSEAQQLLEDLAAMAGADGEALPDPAFDQLRDALESIAEGSEPVDVATVIESLPVVAEAETPAERAPVLQRLLGWMGAALDKHKEASAAAGAMPDGTAQSLQASLFPAGADAADAAAAAKPAEGKQESKESGTDAAAVAVIVPLAAQQQANAAMPAWVRAMGADQQQQASADLDAAIAPLKLDAADDTLPAVTLPGSGDTGSKKEMFEAALARHADAAPAAPDTAPVQADESPIVAVDANGVALAATPATPAAGHGSLTPITLNAHTHLAPHTAAAEQVQVAITRMKDEGLNSITLQLEPADLGRVEIKMEITAEGRTQLHFVVDKPETLDALSRDARSLERALQESGLKADSGSMQFNLRQQPQQQAFEDDAPRGRAGREALAEEENIAATAAITQHYTVNVREGVDIHA